MPECFIYAALFDIVFAHIVCRKVIVGLYVVYEHSLAAFLCFQKRKFGTVFLESHTQSGNYRFQFAVAFDCCLEGDFAEYQKQKQSVRFTENPFFILKPVANWSL